MPIARPGCGGRGSQALESPGELPVSVRTRRGSFLRTRKARAAVGTGEKGGILVWGSSLEREPRTDSSIRYTYCRISLSLSLSLFLFLSQTSPCRYDALRACGCGAGLSAVQRMHSISPGTAPSPAPQPRDFAPRLTGRVCRPGKRGDDHRPCTERQGADTGVLTKPERAEHVLLQSIYGWPVLGSAGSGHAPDCPRASTAVSGGQRWVVAPAPDIGPVCVSASVDRCSWKVGACI